MTDISHCYQQPCSRCGGSGDDPDAAECVCDCCVGGVETLLLTEADARSYPNAKRVDGPILGAAGKGAKTAKKGNLV